MNLKVDHELDTVGFLCPYPIIETSKMMQNIQEGEILAVTSDDRAILLDMPAWCHSHGNEYLGDEKIEQIDGYRVYVRKGIRS